MYGYVFLFVLCDFVGMGLLLGLFGQRQGGSHCGLVQLGGRGRWFNHTNRASCWWFPFNDTCSLF
ncbi:hypothetical protein ACE6H2_014961 [Prunus campanulata]